MLNKETRLLCKLKIADGDDILELKRMALNFKAHSPYRDFPVDEDKIQEFLGKLIDAGPKNAVILMAIVDDKPVGMLVGLAAEFIFSRDRYASEIAWWVDPAFRGSAGKELQEAFAYWAKKVGCKYLSMALLENEDTTKMKKIYKKLGLVPAEQAWIKEI